MEYRTATDLALGPHATAVHRHDLPDDRETEPGPLDASRDAALDSRVTLPDRLKLVRRDAHAVVRDRETDRAVVTRCRYDDLAAGRGVLHGVREEVRDDLCEPVAIGGELGEVRCERERDRMAWGVRPDPLRSIADDCIEVGRLRVQAHATSFH